MRLGKALAGIASGFTPDNVDPWLHALGQLVDNGAALVAAVEAGDAERVARIVTAALDVGLDGVGEDITEEEQDAILEGVVAMVAVIARAARSGAAKPRATRPALRAHANPARLRAIMAAARAARGG